MNITELDQYRLADAVKFHNRLNPKLWGRDEKLLPEVRSKLLEIAADFQEFLGVSDLEVKDITLSGSNAAYSYTPHSDIDLHLVVEQPQQNDEVYQELFNAKKYQYNDIHDIRIHGADVELYVQPANQPAVSLGEYSVLNDQWIEIPKRKRARIDQTLVRHKYEDLQQRIKNALKEDDSDRVQALINKIKQMRQSGLDAHGEFGPENLAFKMLRKQGWIKKLYDHVAAVKDRELSLKEEPKKLFRYGFGSGAAPTASDNGAGDYRTLFKPAVPKEPAVGDLQFKTAQDYEWFKKQQQKKKELASEDAGETWDGVNPTTCMFLNEVEKDPEPVVQDFIKVVAKRLGIRELPQIKLHTDPAWSTGAHSFGRYDPDTHVLNVSLPNRHILDVLRTVAHELTHCRQNQDHPLPDNAGETGSKWENEANARAGIFMRDFAEAHPEYFEQQPLGESASGYIPTKRQAKDPRYSMALTVDIKPGQVGKEANKMKLDTDSQGRPGLLMKTANLRESLAAEFAAFSEGKSYGYGSTPLTQVPGEIEDELGNQEATGPEFPPQMPAGTTKIDVSDLTDWYRLGMDISDLDDADPEDYNQGPPQTVIVFPSDEAEQGYLKQFKRLGLKTHDMDPDVEGGEDLTGKHLHRELEEEFALLEQEFLGEIKMSPTNLRAEAAKTGAMAGMEFEMIVPGISSPDDGSNQEPDYDYDRRCRSIDDVFDFFYDGDYNSRRDVQNVVARMRENYQDWIEELISQEWQDNSGEFILEWVANNVDESEWNPDELEGDARNEALDEFAAAVDADPNSNYYQEAYEEYREEHQEDWDESDWLDSQDLDRMSAIENTYELMWPYWHDPVYTGEADVDAIADDFSNSIGRPVNASSSYHGARREAGHYVVEPDGSLDPDDSDDAGLEFVSPPLPIDELLSDLNKVKAWADREKCYTNDSTGLHINVSVPNFSLEKLDYVKLALLLGDKYVLDQFGRSSNTYTKSALTKVQDLVKRNPESAKALLDKMRNGMEELATKAIHSGTTEKYTSINTKSGYIEFRSPGGDWLNENFDKIENTLLRFTVALSAAINPEAYREEYLKKLYKLLEPTAVEKSPDTIKYFADYVAGKTPKDALRSFIKQAQLERRLKKNTEGPQKMWWEVSNPPYSFASIEVVATSAEEAIDRALGPDGYPNWANTRQTVVAKPLRPYGEKRATVGEPQPVGQASDQAQQQAPGRNYEIYRGDDRDDIVAAFVAADDQAAQERLERYRRDHPNGEYRAQPAPIPGSTMDLQRQRQQAALQQQQAPGTEYIIFKISDRSQLTGFRAANQAAAEREAESILRDLGLDPDLYDVRERHPAQRPQQPAQNPPQPLGAGRELIGWRVLLPSGEEVTQIHGIGNNQGDANRIAAGWLRQNGYGVSGEGYEVVPMWREA